MAKLLNIIKGVLGFCITSIIGAIILYFVEPMLFQESNLKPVIQIAIILGLFFIFIAAMVHYYIKDKTYHKE